MGILDTLRNVITRNRQPTRYAWLNGSTFGFQGTGGPNNDVLRTDDGSALAHSVSIAAYRAVDARMRGVGSMPWRIVSEGTGEVIAQSDDGSPAHMFAIALSKARRELGQPVFALWELSMCITGKAFIEPVASKYGLYTSLDWLNPTRVRINAPGGIIQSFTYTGDMQSVVYDPSELVYERFPNLISDVDGLSPLYVAMQRVNIGINTDRFLAAFFRNNSRFGQIIAPRGDSGFSPQEVDQLKQQLDSSKGSDRGWRSFISPRDIEVFTQDNPDLSKYVEMIERVETSIYTALGVPRPVAGDVDGQRYQASPETLEWFYQNTIIPRCRDIEQVVNNDLLPRFDKSRRVRFEFDTSEWERLSPTRLSQIEAVRQAYLDGIVSLNKYREVINRNMPGVGLAPIDEGNLHLIPGAGVMVKQEQLGALQGKPSYITFQSPQTTIQQAGEMAQGVGLNIPTPPPPETNPASEAPAAIVEDAKENTDSTGAALNELKTWKAYAKKHGAHKARRFECYHLPEELVGRVRYALLDDNLTDGFKAVEYILTNHEPDEYPELTRLYADTLKGIITDEDAIASAVQAHYQRLLAAKSIQSTRIDFEDRVDDLFVAAVNGEINRRRFGNALRSLLQTTIPRAFSDGLEDGGLDRNALDDTDLIWLNEWVDEQRQFVIAVSDAIYKDERVTEEEAKGKGVMWWNKSVAPAYYEGLASASRNAAFEWVYGPTEHCDSCLALNGQVRRMKFWNDTIRPQDDRLQCGGYRCKCNLVPTRKRLSRGRLPKWQFSRAHVHEHDDTHDHD